jgi:ABC-type glycerol-3-phosphate transport system permease component
LSAGRIVAAIPYGKTDEFCILHQRIVAANQNMNQAGNAVEEAQHLVTRALRLSKLPTIFIFTPTLDNFRAVLGQEGFLRSLWNNLVVSGLAVAQVSAAGMASKAVTINVE